MKSGWDLVIPTQEPNIPREAIFVSKYKKKWNCGERSSWALVFGRERRGRLRSEHQAKVFYSVDNGKKRRVFKRRVGASLQTAPKHARPRRVPSHAE